MWSVHVVHEDLCAAAVYICAKHVAVCLRHRRGFGAVCVCVCACAAV